jgi:hypothetical protein
MLLWLCLYMLCGSVCHAHGGFCRLALCVLATDPLFLTWHPTWLRHSNSLRYRLLLVSLS